MLFILYIFFWIILSVCALALIYTVFVHTFLFTYLYIDCQLRTWREPETYPPIAFGVFFKNYWRELWYVLGKIYLYPLKFVNINLPRGEASHKYAVLLLHGYGRCQTDWLWMRKQLQHLPVFTVNLQPTFARIEEITNFSLPHTIRNIRKLTGCEKIILIGHSMGGLVASYYREFLDHNQEISGVITIGTAFHGTKVAIVGVGANARQMCPGSQFLNLLRHKIQHHHQHYYQIATEFENLIFPWESSLLQDIAEDHKLVMHQVPHLSMLHDPQVAKQLNHWIDAITNNGV